jgi:hypothetical protein
MKMDKKDLEGLKMVGDRTSLSNEIRLKTIARDQLLVAIESRKNTQWEFLKVRLIVYQTGDEAGL